jgi:hypothetical protein
MTSPTLSAADLYIAYENNELTPQKGLKAGLDITMAAIGVWGGGVGLAISAPYFILDATIGIENIKVPAYDNQMYSKF